MLSLLPIVGLRAVMRPLPQRIRSVKTIYVARAASHAFLASCVCLQVLSLPHSGAAPDVQRGWPMPASHALDI